MTSERAKRFPLGLEDLVREPRRPEGRPGEVRAAALAASAALNARQQPAKNSPLGSAGKTPAKSPARAQTQPQATSQAKAKAPIKAPVNPTLKPAVSTQAKPQAKPHATTVAQGSPARAAPKPAPVNKPAAKLNERASVPNVALNGALALTSERVRERMVERLRANGVTDQRVLNAMSVVPRHMFVDPGLAAQAYEDAALPIGHHQTISKPSVVARMIELAAAGRALNTVLEIGTGCGYQAAVLSQVARDVYSIERIKPLSERAKTNLRPLRIPNIRLHYGDGRLGLPSAAPFDAIVIAAAGLDVPQALLEQLAIGGRLVAPVGSQEGQNQVLTLVERLGPAQWRESRLDRVFFVPLKSGVI
ncbi:protein-L-isoaspartate(D-aspartate) O-methyltransferase [Paraburkholderia nemoris]|uniref:Protein-L-isoaspartate O-methyltransferase n=1 Tax=Paraburkholderia nemoris TaxID=2793076 RepID=A0ABN7M4D2_9BURK|nr:MULTISPECIES: protein-L-isoaspartate(D-aspartate) O-methyltransferase [Paraburkholderia]MBK3781417.1 protein-L-isoaspartate(D-aspartate) O-methyltransferase [Paraburkholderia aspalathi]MBK3812547.1 protein-L-isoaspartate(D-aspartate) O-methyltransferase [Paraburkholderia aspalathi]CAE6705391.1 Protein-L-isoaspartate O-methyltransferase [Paraburkholderia nemoris]CAE6715495.1 Protein-L-isoaspartate O-methyltransferase [Paraburkholderia nemoris]CAE6724045.1 Protein-L-isoaspartate O-methyltrans